VSGSLRPCEPCDEGKPTRSPFSSNKTVAQLRLKRGEGWSADAEGKLRTLTREHDLYLLTAVENFSGLSVIFMIPKKSAQWELLCSTGPRRKPDEKSKCFAEMEHGTTSTSTA
jgi:hypothetical protein